MTYHYDPLLYPDPAGAGSRSAALATANAGARPEFTDQDSSAGPGR
ncbi:hypothetical protein [Streptomyces sp. NPDC050121]